MMNLARECKSGEEEVGMKNHEALCKHANF